MPRFDESKTLFQVVQDSQQEFDQTNRLFNHMKRRITPLIAIDQRENPRFARSNALLGRFTTKKRCPRG